MSTQNAARAPYESSRPDFAPPLILATASRCKSLAS